MANVAVTNTTGLYATTSNTPVLNSAQQLLTLLDNNGNVNFALDPATNYSTVYSFFTGNAGGGGGSSQVTLYGDVLATGMTGVPINTVLSPTGVVAGTYGNTTQVPSFTVDSKGRILSITSVNIAAGGSTYSNSNVAAYLTTATIDTTGNIQTTAKFIGDGSLLTNLPIGPSNYGNSNVAAYMPLYLPTYAGVLTAGLVSTNNYTWANGQPVIFGSSNNYGNANVASYLSSNTDATITSLWANDTFQQGEINAANAAIATTNANIGGFYTYANATYGTKTAEANLQSEITSNAALIAGLQTQMTSNAALIAGLQTEITSNAALIAGLQTQVTANAAILATTNTNLGLLQANVGSFYTYANATYSTIANAAVQEGEITSLRGNITAANAAIKALSVNVGNVNITQTTSNNSLSSMTMVNYDVTGSQSVYIASTLPGINWTVNGVPPTNARTVLNAGNVIIVGTSSAIWMSNNGGVSYNNTLAGVSPGFISSLQDVTGNIWVTGSTSGYSGYLFRSSDYGVTWKPIAALNATALNQYYTSGNGWTISATLSGGGDVYTSSVLGGSNFTHNFSFPQNTGSVVYIPGGANGNIVVSSPAGLALSTDGAATFNSVGDMVPANFVINTGTSLLASGSSVTNPGPIVSRSTDNGHTWQDVLIDNGSASGTSGMGPMISIGNSATGGQIVLAAESIDSGSPGDAGLWYSLDDGRTWTVSTESVFNGPSSGYIKQLTQINSQIWAHTDNGSGGTIYQTPTTPTGVFYNNAGNNLVANIYAYGNVAANSLITTSGIFWANGQPFTFATTYGNTQVAQYLPTYTGNIGGNLTAPQYFVNSIGSKNNSGYNFGYAASDTLTINANTTNISGTKIVFTVWPSPSSFSALTTLDQTANLTLGGTGAGNSGSLISSGGIYSTNGYFWANGTAYSSGSSTYGNTQVAAYLPTYTGTLANSSSVVLLQSEIASNATLITGLQTQVTSNASLITGLQTQVTANAALITGLQTQMTSNAATIATHTTQIAGLQTQITSNAALITGLQTQMTSNAALITGLQTQVTANAATLSALQANVGSFYTYANLHFGDSNYGNANVAAYLPTYTGTLANSSSVVLLQSEIASNAALITGLQTQMTSNAAILATHQTEITSNAALITGLQTQMTSNAALISGLQTQVTANAATLSTLSANVGGFYTYANATYETKAGLNTDIGTYLTSGAGSITASFGNIITTNGLYWSNGAPYSTGGGGGSYGNVNVSTYLPHATGYTDGWQMPIGGNTARPSFAGNGTIRFNSDTLNPEWYNGTTATWYNFSQAYAPTPAVNNAWYVLVAGGAAGGGSIGGGGGAGGYLEGNVTLSSGTTYTFTVGGGGSGVSGQSAGNNGSNTTGFSLTAIGGGGGASWDSVAPNNGGSGGGGHGGGSGNFGYGSGTTGQGYDGGAGFAADNYGSGGGGATTAGVQGVSGHAGDGGTGATTYITGSATSYAGGGGGGSNGAGGTGGIGGTGGGGNGAGGGGSPSAGTANTGGGGGSSSIGTTSGAGGSGVVIVRILTANYTGTTTGSPTVTTSGSYTIMTFTSSGSYTA